MNDGELLSTPVLSLTTIPDWVDQNLLSKVNCLFLFSNDIFQQNSILTLGNLSLYTLFIMRMDSESMPGDRPGLLQNTETQTDLVYNHFINSLKKYITIVMLKYHSQKIIPAVAI